MNVSSRTLQIPTARIFLPLLKPSRYKGAWGGRGSGKSHFFAEKLIDDSLYEKGMASVCIREVQKSLKDSAKRLIENKLQALGLGEADGFKVFNDKIETPGDGIIIFQGMQDHTAESIKSLEGFKRAWAEEAQTLSATSLSLLRPTIRANQSELWFSWNARRKSDPVDLMLRGTSLPTDSRVVRANWADNPWFPATLEQERLDCLKNSPEQYDHIWEGGYATVLSGAYYAKQLAEAKKRIGNVAADTLLPIRLVADIGGTGRLSDNFVFWAVQFVNREIRWLNHYEVQGQEIGHHLNWMRSQKYTPERAQIILPHDGSKPGDVYNISYQSAFESAGYDVEVVKNQGPGAAMLRVEALRRVFPMCWFNEPTTRPGLDALGWYHEKIDDQRTIGLGPDHDWSSHSADAAGLVAVVYETPRDARTDQNSGYQGEGSWMS